MLISDDYRLQNKLLHESNQDYGVNGKDWAGYVAMLVGNNKYSTLLDYGCGKGRLKTELEKNGVAITVAEYDPAIDGKESPPEPAELVTCTDVLEHIEPVHLNAVLRDLRRLTKRRLFVDIATGEAMKTLPDGRNAHLIVRPSEWWRAKMAEHFQILNWEARGFVVAAELSPKPYEGRRRAQKRRALTSEVIAMLEDVKQQVNMNSDAFSQVHNYRMWESIDDEPADLTAAVAVVEHVDDVDWALSEVAKNTRKVSLIMVVPDEYKTPQDWRRFIEKRFRIASWFQNGPALVAVGAPGVMVQGVTAVGAVQVDKRWDQVLAATKRIPKRIQTAEAHERRAILVCYGPSLKENMGVLKAHLAEGNCDVISVSGSHDMLLEAGITPRFHVECDPRPHKTNNLKHPVPGVEYLIASTCHENYFDKLEAHNADVRLWHVSEGEHFAKLVGEMKESPRHIISGGGSVGLRSVPLLYGMGYRSFSIFAMDCSFADEGNQQWAGAHAGKRQDVVEVMCGDRLFYSSPILLTYATGFFEMVQKAPEIEFRLYGDGLLQAMCRLHQMGATDFDPAPSEETAAKAEAA